MIGKDYTDELAFLANAQAKQNLNCVASSKL